MEQPRVHRPHSLPFIKEQIHRLIDDNEQTTISGFKNADRLFAIGDPNTAHYVIREYPPYADVPAQEARAHRQKMYQFTEKLLDELNTKYHIAVPKHTALIGQGTNTKEALHIIVERISGKRILDFNGAEITEHLSEIVTVYQAILKKAKDVLDNGGPFLDDLTPKQFLYGRPEKDTGAPLRMYFVDLDPSLRIYRADDETSVDIEVPAIYGMARQIRAVLDTVLTFEERCKDEALFASVLVEAEPIVRKLLGLLMAPPYRDDPRQKDYVEVLNLYLELCTAYKEQFTEEHSGQ